MALGSIRCMASKTARMRVPSWFHKKGSKFNQSIARAPHLRLGGTADTLSRHRLDTGLVADHRQDLQHPLLRL